LIPPTPGGRLIFHVFGALGEFERGIIRERTMAGLNAARARGRKGGRPPKLTGKQADMAVSTLKDPNNSIEDICKAFHVSFRTLHRLAQTTRPPDMLQERAHAH
jgi:DNA invertase Pin-like site-specific DNA recombinase